jgi:hypothetical protein
VDELANSVDLADAIEALRAALMQAMRGGEHSRVRFRLEPVELTVHVGVTRTGTGKAGVKWHILTLGGERSRQTEATQTLKIQLTPILFDEQDNEISPDEQLIRDQARNESPAEAALLSPDPA